MTFAATIVAGGTIYAAERSKDAAEDATTAQTLSSQQGIDFQREALEGLRADLDPFRRFGTGALENLQGMLGVTPSADTRNMLPDGRQLSPEFQQSILGRDSSRTDRVIEDLERSQSEVRRLESEKQQALQQGAQDTAAYIENFINQHRINQSRWESELESSPMTQSSLEYYIRSGQESKIPQGTFIEPQEQVPGQTQAQVTPDRSNPLLDQAMAERAAYDPMSSPLLSRAQQDRMAFDPLANPLLQKASQQQMAFDPLGDPLVQQARESQMAFDPMSNLGPGVLQNPLLKAMQEDVTRRLMANQAARGKLGSGGTAEALQQRLVPQAIQFGQMLNQQQRQNIQDQARLGFQSTEMQRQGIADTARLGGAQVALQDAAMSGREGLGFGLDQLQRQGIGDRMQAGMLQEDLRQRDIANLMDAAGIGQGSAARVGAAGQSAALVMGNLALAAGQAQAQGAYDKALANNQMVGGLAGTALYGLGQFNPAVKDYFAFQNTTGERYT